MPPNPSSACATHGSVKSSRSITKISPPILMNKTKVKSHGGTSHSRNVSSPKLFKHTNNRPASTAFRSDDAALYEGQYSQADLEHFRLSPFNIHHSPTPNNGYTASQVDLDVTSSIPSIPFRTRNGVVVSGDDSFVSQSEFTSMSSVHLSRHCAQTSYDDYSVNHFVSEDACALLPCVPAEESIQSHTKSMKAYLEAFDLIFYQA